jgi:Ca2+-binding EF-hand superfamily protein
VYYNIFYYFALQIFRVFDINNDGTVSQKELARIVKDLFHLFKKEDNPDKVTLETIALEAFKEMDTNSDGRVTQEEFVRACLHQESISTMLALKVIDVFI